MINAVVDLSHHNKLTSPSKMMDSGVRAVFHKATQGTNFLDPTFSENKKRLSDSGILFGAYHFGTAGSASAQAEYFLLNAGKDVPLVLDFEPNPQGKDISLEEAEEFVHYLFQATGRYPGLYSGHTIKEVLRKSGITHRNQTELSKCWLWIAQYSQAPLIPTVWEKWTFWQYTDGAAGPLPHITDGVGRADRNFFNGNEDELKEFWLSNSI